MAYFVIEDTTPPSLVEMPAPPSQPPASGSGTLVAHFDAGANIEQVENLPINTSAQTPSQVFFKLGPIDVEPGDIIQAYGQMQATNDQGYNVRLAVQMRMADADNLPNSGDVLYRIVSRNITPDMHHDVRDVIGSVVVTGSARQVWIIVAGDASSGSTQSGHTLKIEQGRARLRALRFRPA